MSLTGIIIILLIALLLIFLEIFRYGVFDRLEFPRFEFGVDQKISRENGAAAAPYRVFVYLSRHRGEFRVVFKIPRQKIQNDIRVGVIFRRLKEHRHAPDLALVLAAGVLREHRKIAVDVVTHEFEISAHGVEIFLVF